MSGPVATVTLHPALDQTVTLAGLVPGAVNQAASMRFDAGGKGVNVASYLADHGLAAIATGLLGEENPAPFTALFAQKGIEDQLVRVPGPTRVNVKLVDTARGETTDLNLPARAPPAAALVELDRRLDALAARCGWFVLAGSVPPGVPADVYAVITARLRARGRRVALDASGRPLAEAVAAGPDLVKPNRAELEELLGARLGGLAEVVEAARALRARGPRLVVVSLGAEGAVFVGDDGAWRARPPPVARVATTVGAGDALVAGVVAGLHAGLALPEVARLATAFAASKLARVGPHLGPPEERRALSAQVEIAPVG